MIYFSCISIFSSSKSLLCLKILHKNFYNILILLFLPLSEEREVRGELLRAVVEKLAKYTCINILDTYKCTFTRVSVEVAQLRSRGCWPGESRIAG